MKFIIDHNGITSSAIIAIEDVGIIGAIHDHNLADAIVDVLNTNVACEDREGATLEERANAASARMFARLEAVERLRACAK